MIRVLLADDQELVRAGFRMILDAQPDMRVAGEVATGADAVDMVRRHQIDVVLMDVRMPGMDGVEATGRIRQSVEPGAGPKVLILTTFDLDDYVYAGLRAGASGFLLKSTKPALLLEAIRAVASGDAIVDPTVTRRLLERFIATGTPPDVAEQFASLTDRERTVLLEIAAGHNNAEIAARLHLSEATIKTHVSHVLLKLQLRDRVQAVIYVYDHGLLASTPALPAPG